MTSGPSGSQPYGTTTPYTATVTPTTGNFPTGQVQFYVSGGAIGANTPYGSPVSLTTVSPFTASFVPNPPLAVSATPYVVTAHFLGDPGDGASISANNITTTIITAPTVTTLSFSANPIVYGQPLILSGTVMSGGGIPTGTVTITGITGTTGCSGVTVTATGTYSCTITTPGPSVSGSPYTPINANYTPSAGTGYVASSSANGTLTVNTASTQVSAPNVTASTGTSFTFHAQATAVAPSVAPVSAGSISFYSLVGMSQSTAACAGGTALATNVTVDGVGNASSGSVTLPSSATPYTICAVYTPAGGGNFTGSTSAGQNVTSPATQTSDAVSTPTGGPGVFGQPVTITATVTATAGALPPTPGTLTFNDDAGHGSVQIGTTQTVTANGATTAVASVTVSNLVVGGHGVTATYTSSNGAFASPTTSAPGIIIITQASANFTVSSGAPNPVTSGGSVIVGTPVTLIATYTGGVSPAPTGTVNFINTADGNAIVCSGTLSAGVATCNGVAGVGGNLPAGSENISITYVGDANYTLGLVNTFGFTVTKAGTTTLLVPFPNPATVGNTITLSATVTVTRPSIAPTGTVSFTLGGNPPLASTCTGPISLTTNPGPPITYTATCTFELTGPGGLSPTGVPITYTATYSGDANTAPSTGTNSLTSLRAATTTTLVATPNPATLGQTVTLTATVASSAVGINPTGTYTFTLGGNVPPTSTCGVPAAINPATGVATCTFEFFGPAGSITYSATYSGDADFLASANTTSLTSNKAATTTALAATPNPATVGQTVTLTATVSTTVAGISPTGTYSFTLGGNTAGVGTCGTPAAINPATGVATCTFELAGPAGSISYTATYSGDTNFLTSTNSTSLTANKAATATTLVATPNSAPLGTVVTLTATVSESPAGSPVSLATAFSGSFTFGLNGGLLSGTVAGSPTTSCGSPVPVSPAGVATCSFEIYSAANNTYTFTATYSSTDPSFLSSSNSTTLTTLKAPTGQVTFTLSPAAPVSGQPLTLTVTVNAGGSPTLLPLPTGTVTITGSGVNVTAALTNGVATVVTGTGAGNLPALFAGSYNLVVTYNGDSNYLAGAAVPLSPPLVIGKANAALSLTSGNNATTVTVTAVSPATGTPTGLVTIYSGNTATGTPVATGSLINGVFSVAVPQGTYTATYGGDNNFNAISGSGGAVAPPPHPSTTTIITASVNPPAANQPVVLTASVIGTGGSGSPTGTVTFTDNGTAIGTAALSGGVASITVTLPAGSNTIVATYGGDSVYSGSSGSYGLTVNRPASTFTFSSNLSAAVYGQSVTLTVKITQSGTAVPTGTVQFYDNGAPVGGAVALAGGTATLTLSNLPPGVNNITVVYSGDANYGSFSGNGGSVTVSMAQTLATLTANTNNGLETLTATVAVVAPGGGTPTGTVKFIDTVTGKVVGTATLAGGMATITIPVTTDPIMAVYSGDGNFATSGTVNVSAIAVVNSASYAIDFSQDEIVTVFGSGLTTQTVTATLPLQTTLGGVSVMVTDSAGTARPAVLFYVSATQIAFMIPAGTANGTATVAVSTASGTSTATITVTNSAPGLFTANDSGAGPLAAQVVSVAAGGAQTYTNTAALNGQSFVNAPIALTPAGNTFFLLLYGTGIRFGSAITVTINGTTYTPTYAGAQGTYAGLDQINVLLPASLAGSGTVTVTVTVDGTLTNAGTITFQ